jgi:hypothetical protein
MSGLQHMGAFVVQFRTDNVVSENQVSGRLEHVASGRTATFHSREELIDLLDSMLREVLPSSLNRSALPSAHRKTISKE